MKKIQKTEYAVLAYVAVIFLVSLIPGKALGRGISINDKLLHMLMFGILGFLAAFSERKKAVMWAVLLIVTVAALSEGLQRFAPGRDPDMWDFVSDVTGGILVLCTGRIFRVHRLMQTKNRPE